MEEIHKATRHIATNFVGYVHQILGGIFMDGNSQPTKSYQKTWFMWVLLILFSPVGIFLMWKYKKFGKVTRITLSIIFGLFFFATITPSNKDDAQIASKETGELTETISITNEDSSSLGEAEKALLKQSYAEMAETEKEVFGKIALAFMSGQLSDEDKNEIEEDLLRLSNEQKNQGDISKQVNADISKQIVLSESKALSNNRFQVTFLAPKEVSEADIKAFSKLLVDTQAEKNDNIGALILYFYDDEVFVGRETPVSIVVWSSDGSFSASLDKIGDYENYLLVAESYKALNEEYDLSDEEKKIYDTAKTIFEEDNGLKLSDEEVYQMTAEQYNITADEVHKILLNAMVRRS